LESLKVIELLLQKETHRKLTMEKSLLKKRNRQTQNSFLVQKSEWRRERTESEDYFVRFEKI
jgi:hypothetical protein